MSIIWVALAIPLLAVFMKSTVAEAIADSIRANSGAAQVGYPRHVVDELRAEVEALRMELDDVRGHLLESAERLDFAERLLASHRSERGGEAA